MTEVKGTTETDLNLNWLSVFFNYYIINIFKKISRFFSIDINK